MARRDALRRSDVSRPARRIASSAVGWALVGALVPVCQAAVQFLGSASWPVVVLGGALVGGLVLGSLQALVVGGDAVARRRWVFGTAAGVAVATATIGVVGALGGAGGVGAAAGLALGAVQLRAAAPRPPRGRRPGWGRAGARGGAAPPPAGRRGRR